MAAPNRFKLDWVRKNFAARIQELATAWFDQSVKLTLELAQSSVQPQPGVSAATLFQQQAAAVGRTESEPSAHPPAASNGQTQTLHSSDVASTGKSAPMVHTNYPYLV